MVLGPPAVVSDPLQVTPGLRAQRGPALSQLLVREQASLDALRQLDFLLGVEQRYLADLLEIVLDRVRRRSGDRHLRRGQILVVVTVDERLVLALFAARLARLDHALCRAGRARPAGRARVRRGLGVVG